MFYWFIVGPELFQVVLKLLDKYGNYFRIWLGPELNVVISDPKDLEVCNSVNSLNYVYSNKQTILSAY